MSRKPNPVKSTRKFLERQQTYKERVKVLRAYQDDFDSGDGFDLRSPDTWTPAQKAKVTRRYNKIDSIVDAQVKHDYDIDLLNQRIKKIRPYFGDTFKAKGGYDLHDIDQWSKAKKKKATKYFLAMSPELMTEKKVVKRMRDPLRLEKMILRSDQTELLPGQTAAVFHVEKGRTVSVEMTKAGKITYELDGVLENELTFNIAALHKDSDKELDRVLSLTDANVFRMQLIVGQGYDTFDREDIRAEVNRYLSDYKRKRKSQAKWNEFMTGLVAYPGETMRQVAAQSRQQKKVVEERLKIKRATRAKARKPYTIQEIKQGHRMTPAQIKRAKATGRY